METYLVAVFVISACVALLIGLVISRYIWLHTKKPTIGVSHLETDDDHVDSEIQLLTAIDY